MEIQQVISNIRALCRKTTNNGCTEAEAMSAANKIGELMQVYNLTMDRVFLGESKCIADIIQTKRGHKHPIDSCITGIGRFCDCICWFSKPRGQIEYNFFGLETDVEMAKYLYSIILNAIDTSTEEFKKTDDYINGTEYGQYVSRKRLSTSFQRGMSYRIYQRLDEMTVKRHNEEEIKSPIMESTGTSLVLVKRRKIDNDFEKLGVKLRNANCFRPRIHQSAFNHGKEIGNKVNLNRPLNSQVSGYLK
jgi:hypothetical protein